MCRKIYRVETQAGAFRTEMGSVSGVRLRAEARLPVGIYDRDYMREKSPEQASSEYERGAFDSEYGNYTAGRKRMMKWVIPLLVIIALGIAAVVLSGS
ncbi:MAG: hypothetical protein E4H02_10530 [Lentisphaerales bacterium]|nr:MAG: hypothetical protein E4H02_10530 [Lentisphaerales bacterium]